MPSHDFRDQPPRRRLHENPAHPEPVEGAKFVEGPELDRGPRCVEGPELIEAQSRPSPSLPLATVFAPPRSSRPHPAGFVLLFLVLFALPLFVLPGCGGGGGGGGGAIETAPPGNPLTPEDLLQLGNAAFARGEYENAITNYQKLLDNFLGSELRDDALIGMGDAQVELKAFEEARVSYKRVIDDFPNGDQVANAKLSIAKSHKREGDLIDGGTPGFVDPIVPGEFIANLQAKEAFLAVARDASLPESIRSEAQFSYAEALFRERNFPAARAAFDVYISPGLEPVTDDAAGIQRAHIQKGLAFIQEGGPTAAANAEASFRSAGATSMLTAASPAIGTEQFAQFGSIPIPLPGLPGLDEIVVKVISIASTATTTEDLNLRADLGIALALAYVQNDLRSAASRLEALAEKNKPEPLGDLVLFQLAEVRLQNRERDEAVRQYQRLLDTFPESVFAQRAHFRIGSIIFEVFNEEAATKTRIEFGLVSNLIASLRKAVGTRIEGGQARVAREGALSLIGALEGRGIPLPLTIAQPRGLQQAFEGAPYEQQLGAFGATGTVTWSLAADSSLPSGLTLASTGLISGTPTAAGQTIASITATDSEGESDTREFVLDVDPSRFTSAPRLLDAIVGRPYTAQLTAEGQAPFAFDSVRVQRVTTQGSLSDLPGFIPGLTLSGDGTITGTPTQSSGSQPFFIAVRATDSRARTQVAHFALFVQRQGQTSPVLPFPAPPPGFRPLNQIAQETTTVQQASQVAQQTATSTFYASLPPFAQELAISPDGSKLYAISGIFNNVLTEIDIATKAQRELRFTDLPPITFPSSLAVSPDGQHAAVVTFSQTLGEMFLIDLSSLQVLHRRPIGPRAQAVVFTPDSTKAVTFSQTQLTSLNVSDTTTLVVDTSFIGQGRALTPLPNSRLALVAGEFTSNLAALVDLETGSTRTFSIPGSSRFASALPNGTTVVLSEHEGTRLFVLNLSTGNIDTHFVGRLSGPFAVSRNGRIVAAQALASSELTVFEVESGRIRRIPLALPSRSEADGESAVLITADGEKIVVFDNPGETDSAAIVLTDTLDRLPVPAAGLPTRLRARSSAVLSPNEMSAFLLGESFPPPTGFVRQLALGEASSFPIVTRTVLLEAEVGLAFTHQLQVRGGTAPHTFSPGSGGLGIAGLQLSPSGLLSGTPEQAGLHAIDGTVTDVKSTSTSFSVPLFVNSPSGEIEPLVLLTQSLPESEAGVEYQQTLAGIGGSSPYAFSVARGQLPTGITLLPNGVLSGVPVRVTSVEIEFTLRDSKGMEASRIMTLVVDRDFPLIEKGTFELGAPAEFLVALDLDKDGRDDLAVAHDSSTTNVSLLISTEAGLPGSSKTLAVADPPAGAVRELHSGDFNGDGSPDLLARTFPGLGTRDPPLSRPALVPLLGDGNGGLNAGAPIDVFISVVNAVAGDLDGDRLDDVVAATSLNIPPLGVMPTVFFRLADAAGNFRAVGDLSTAPKLFTDLALGSILDPPRVDLAVLNLEDPSVPRNVVIYPTEPNGTANLSQGSVVDVGATTSTGSVRHLQSADLDGNGRSDLIVSLGDGMVRVVLTTSEGTFTAPAAYPVGTVNGRPVAADVTGDGFLDILLPSVPKTASNKPGLLEILPGVGDGTFDVPLRRSLDFVPASVTSGDFNGDGLPDVALVEQGAFKLEVFHNSKGRR